MAELSKEAKLILLIDGILSFIFFFLFFIIPEIYFELSDFGDVTTSVYQTGLAFLVFGIFLVLSIKINDFEKIKIAWAMAWVAALTILNIYNAFSVPGEIDTNIVGWFNIILGIVIIVLNILSTSGS